MARWALILVLGTAVPVPGVARGQESSSPPEEAPATGSTPEAAPKPEPPAAGSPAGSPADAEGPPAGPSDSSARPEGELPPHYYVEPEQPMRPPRGPGAAPPPYEPPPPGPMVLVDEPPPPLRSRHRSPRSAFWTGARLGWFIPFGTLWHDAFAVGGSCCDFRRRTWSDYAAPGPLFEINAGARLGRHYNVFALWEHAILGAGGLDENSFGGQNVGATNLYGAGLRFSSNPDDVGFLVELALGYRHFSASWEDGTELHLGNGFFDARIGLGADIRLNRRLSLSPLVKVGSGVFSDATFEGPNGEGSARDPFDESGQYGTLSFELGVHFDVY